MIDTITGKKTLHCRILFLSRASIKGLLLYEVSVTVCLAVWSRLWWVGWCLSFYSKTSGKNTPGDTCDVRNPPGHTGGVKKKHNCAYGWCLEEKFLGLQLVSKTHLCIRMVSEWVRGWCLKHTCAYGRCQRNIPGFIGDVWKKHTWIYRWCLKEMVLNIIFCIFAHVAIITIGNILHKPVDVNHGTIVKM